MTDILEKICRDKLPEIEAAKKEVSLSELKKRACAAPIPPDFTASLKKPGVRIITELKKASPSKGLIRENFDFEACAEELEEAGAAALSVLTERNYFLGSLDFLRRTVERVRIPVLRKDFIFDPYQIYEAKAAGASAVLLIAAMLDDQKLHELAEIAGENGLAVLGEAHDEREVERILRSPVGVIGVNARDLRTFQTDLKRVEKLVGMIPADRVAVAESAIKNRDDIHSLRAAGAGAFLIGETLMRAPRPGIALKELLS